jgi:hypothetical protein
MLVHSSHDTLRIDDEGHVVHARVDTDDLRSATVLASIRRFDIGEYGLTYGRPDDEVDILDLGYWHGGDGYEPPAYEWRASFRPYAFDPNRLGM